MSILSELSDQYEPNTASWCFFHASCRYCARQSFQDLCALCSWDQQAKRILSISSSNFDLQAFIHPELMIECRFEKIFRTNYFLIFPSKVQNLTVFEFLGCGNYFRRGFPLHSVHRKNIRSPFLVEKKSCFIVWLSLCSRLIEDEDVAVLQVMKMEQKEPEGLVRLQTKIIMSRILQVAFLES